MLSITHLFELNKVEKMIASGKLSRKGTLKAGERNMIRSPERMLRGIKTVNKKIINATGSTYHPNMKSGWIDAFGGAATVGGKKTGRANVFMGKGSGMFGRPERELVKRHEADEARSLNKQYKKYGGHSIAQLHRGDSPNMFTVVGAHASPRVLSREKKNIDYLNKGFGLGRNLKDYRKMTGEYDFVKNLKDKGIRSIEKSQGKLIKQNLKDKEKLFAKKRESGWDQEDRMKYKHLGSAGLKPIRIE
jgi:hypothetical protein